VLHPKVQLTKLGERVPVNKESLATVERAIERSKHFKSTKAATTLDTGIFKSSLQINQERWAYLYQAQLAITTRSSTLANLKMVKAAILRRRVAKNQLNHGLTKLAKDWRDLRIKVKLLEAQARLEEEEALRQREIKRQQELEIIRLA
jgi:hypothetical protein